MQRSELVREQGVVSGRARRSLLVVGLIAGACTLGSESSEQGDVESASHGLSALQERVLGFESVSDWSSPSGALAASSNTTQGAQALAVTPQGWTEINSIPLDSLGPVNGAMSYDLRLPAVAPWGETRAILIAPSLGLYWTELGSQSLASLSAGVYQTVTFAIPSALQSALAGTYTDLKIKLVINGPVLGAPYLIDNIQIAANGVPPGVPPEQLSIRTPSGIPPEGTFLSATDHLSLFSRVVVGASGQTPAVANFGSGIAYLQAEAVANANLYSVGNVQLDVKTRVNGFLRTQGSVTKQGVGTADAPVITGGELAGVQIVSDLRTWFASFPSPNQGDVFLPAAPAGQTLEHSLDPGSYGVFNIHDRNVVVLRSGVYSFESFNTEPQAQIRLDKANGPIFIYVRSSFQYKGAFVDDGVALGQTLVGYIGTSDAFVQAPFTGTLVAPRATVRLERPTSGQHRGSFFGKALEVAAGQPALLHVPFLHFARVLSDASHQGDNAAEPPVRARWVRPDGTPVRSFSYKPITQPLLQHGKSGAGTRPLPRGKVVHSLRSGPSDGESAFSGFEAAEPTPSAESGVLWLQPPSDLPQESLSIQIENTAVSSLGTTVAYSVMVRTWGMGNFFGDSTIVPASTSTFIDAGQVRTETFDVAPHLLIRTPEMAAKADFVVGLHRILSGNVVEATPFAFVGIPSFYYNYTSDLTGVFTYGLERPPAGSAPSGEVEVDGLVERYQNGVLGGDMFEPEGFAGGTPADDARADHLVVFADRGHAVFGVRPSTHSVDASGNLVTPVEAPLPPAGSGGITNPFDPATGQTTLCWRWPVSYIDKGTEPYPSVIAEAEWNGLVDFIPAGFAFADLYDANGTFIAQAQLDANGCLPPQNLGTGNYLFRLFTHSFQNSGVAFRVEAAEPVEQPNAPPFFIAPRRAFSLTASLFIHAPGGAFHIQTGYWTHTTNLAGIASHAMRRHFAGFDMGLTSGNVYLMAVDDIDCFSVSTTNPGLCNDQVIFPVSHFSPGDNTVFIAAASDVWTHDARWKFVIGHEVGHQVQDFANAGLGVVYWFNGDTSTSDNTQALDPASSLATDALRRNCSCSFVEPENASHCLHSIEVDEPAQQEGFGHFFATRLWNRVPGEDGFDGSCNFQYYKQVSSTNIVNEPMIHPVPVNCAAPFAHRDMLCGDVQIFENGSPAVAGMELDWLTYYWDVTTNPASPAPISVSNLLAWYAAANTAVGTGRVHAEDFIAQAPSNLQAFLTGRAQAHAVHDNIP